jgi:hypothetical protein
VDERRRGSQPPPRLLPPSRLPTQVGFSAWSLGRLRLGRPGTGPRAGSSDPSGARHREAGPSEIPDATGTRLARNLAPSVALPLLRRILPMGGFDRGLCANRSACNGHPRAALCLHAHYEAALMSRRERMPALQDVLQTTSPSTRLGTGRGQTTGGQRPLRSRRTPSGWRAEVEIPRNRSRQLAAAQAVIFGSRDHTIRQRRARAGGAGKRRGQSSQWEDAHDGAKTPLRQLLQAGWHYLDMRSVIRKSKP